MIWRGTTPTIVLTLSDFELRSTDEIHVYFSKGRRLLLEKETPDVEIDTENSKIIVPLTQEDTFKLKVGEIKMQCRIKLLGGTVLATDEAYEEVSDIDDNDEVI